MNAVIYARVSTHHQDYARQLADLRAFAKRSGIEILKVFEEKISTLKKREDRPQLKAMFEYIKANQVQKILCWELSRLGRTTIDTLQIIEQTIEDKICLHVYNLNIETLTPDGRVNVAAKFMLTIMAELANMERLQLQQRLNSGYLHHRNKGGRVGRKKGYQKPVEELKSKHADILRLLRQGLSTRQIAAITGKAPNTVIKMKKVA